MKKQTIEDGDKKVHEKQKKAAFHGFFILKAEE